MKELLGSPVPRIFTPPLRELTPETTAGFAVIEFAREMLGIELLPWQEWLVKHALELLPDGTFRFRTVVILVARQNGKSTLAQVVSLFFLYVRGVALVIGTAQNLDIAEEVWQGAVDMAEDVPELAEEIARVNKTNGKKALELHGGYRYKVQAANRRGGRGLSGDFVLMDELREHQTWAAWGAITKTTLARKHAQVWALSNAGDTTSVVLRRLRYLAHMALGNPDKLVDPNLMGVSSADAEAVEATDKNADETLGVFEWSAPPGCDLDDTDGIRWANPSLGHTITLRAILGALATDPEWTFRTEVLCQWEERITEGPFPKGAWDAGIDALSEIAEDSKLFWGVDVSADRSHAHIAVAGLRADGNVHVEITASRPGVDWVRGWFKERIDKGRTFRFAAQRRGAPVSSLVEDLESIKPEKPNPQNTYMDYGDWSGSELGNGASKLWDLVNAGIWEPSDEVPEAPQRLYHLPQPVLDVAAANAVTKSGGDGPILWDRSRSPVDISPLVAANAAVWLACQPEPEPEPESYYASNELEWF